MVEKLLRRTNYWLAVLVLYLATVLVYVLLLGYLLPEEIMPSRLMISIVLGLSTMIPLLIRG